MFQPFTKYSPTFRFLSVLVVTFVLPSFSAAQSFDGLKANLEKLLKTHNVPGASIAIVVGDEIVWAEGLGVVQVGSAKIDSTTLFQAASLSKPVTAFATLRLVEAGKLNLDVPVQQYVKSYDLGTARNVTLRQLLSHSAALTVHGFGGYQQGQRMPTLGQILAGRPPANSSAIVLNGRPGQSYKYSGGGYCVLQQALTDVTGKTFPDAMSELVLAPLKMNESTFQQPIPNDKALKAATGHDTRGRPKYGRWNNYPEMAAAGLWTTPSDLARFIIAVQTAYVGGEGKELGQELAREMLNPQVTGGPGLGLFVWGDEEGSFNHSGSNNGFRCMFRGTKKPGTGIVIMTNSDHGDRLTDPIQRIVNKALEK